MRLHEAAGNRRACCGDVLAGVGRKSSGGRRSFRKHWSAPLARACEFDSVRPAAYFWSNGQRDSIEYEERVMRIYYDIDLTTRKITKRELHGEEIVRADRYWIAKTLLELGAATVDPLSPANPLIFSAGPFAGTSFSNANRTSVGCKSPLTGGIKEANGGGTFSYGLGQLKIAGFTLHGASSEWVVIHFRKD